GDRSPDDPGARRRRVDRESAGPGNHHPISFQMPSVLIIDDEPNIRRMVGALLGAEGYDVRDASDGSSGAMRASENEPDVVLLDLMMPGDMDGMATLERLRAEIPGSPVVVMSGKAGLSDAARATKLSGVTCL